MGNTHILDEICAQEYIFADTAQCTDMILIADEPVLEVDRNYGVWEFVQQKFSRIRGGIRHFCLKLFRKTVGVLLEN